MLFKGLLLISYFLVNLSYARSDIKNISILKLKGTLKK